MLTISIKLGKRVQEFNIERTICGIVLTNPDTHSICLSIDLRRGTWITDYTVREIEFFEEELKELTIKFVKKNKI